MVYKFPKSFNWASSAKKKNGTGGGSITSQTIDESSEYGPGAFTAGGGGNGGNHVVEPSFNSHSVFSSEFSMDDDDDDDDDSICADDTSFVSGNSSKGGSPSVTSRNSQNGGESVRSNGSSKQPKPKKNNRSLSSRTIPVWNDEVKIQAGLLLRDKIVALMEKTKEMKGSIETMQERVEASVESGNKIGSIIFMKLLIKYETERDAALRAISLMRDYAQRLRYSDSYMNYTADINNIMAGKTVDATLSQSIQDFDKDYALEDVNVRLEQVAAKISGKTTL